jgi:hypothetical protein
LTYSVTFRPGHSYYGGEVGSIRFASREFIEDVAHCAGEYTLYSDNL